MAQLDHVALSELALRHLAAQFRHFAEQECDSSPLYRRLSLGIAEDPQLLALAAQAQNTPIPNLLFAAVHFLLLAGATYPLTEFFFHTSERDPYPVFRDFCFQRRGVIEKIIRTRLVQTNEVRRCALLLPAFLQATREPLALIEIGASAGLNLWWDQYGYDYGETMQWGDEDAPLMLRSTLRGDIRPLLNDHTIRIVSRVGIDLNPLDVHNLEDVLWLSALIWPGVLYSARAEQLEKAVAVAQRERRIPATLIKGDALERLPEALTAVPNGVTACVFHSFTLNQFPPMARQHFWALLADYGKMRPIVEISLEWLGGDSPLLGMSAFAGGARIETVLAACHPHGEWIEWKKAKPR